MADLASGVGVLGDVLCARPACRGFEVMRRTVWWCCMGPGDSGWDQHGELGDQVTLYGTAQWCAGRDGGTWDQDGDAWGQVTDGMVVDWTGWRSV